MTTTTTTRTTTTRARPAVAALSAGLVLTLLATALPWVDRATSGTLATHIRAGYPELSAGRIDAVVGVWLSILTGIGALGAVCWLVAIWAVATGRAWARWVVAASFAVGTSVALFLLTVRENTGDVALPPLIGWTGVVPTLAGLAAVVLLWRRPSPRPAV